LKIKIE